MTHTGRSYFPVIEPGSDRIESAIVDQDRIVVDWEETDGKRARFEIIRKSGINFEGNFGYTSLDQGKLATFRKVMFDVYLDRTGEVLLLGKWWNERDGGGSEWMLKLSPVTAK